MLSTIAARLPVTLELTLLALGLALGLALVLGILAAVRPNGPLDVGVSVLTALGIAMPNFWIAILLILLFALHLRWLPSSGSVPLSQDLLGNLRAMALPAITLSAAYFSNLARLTRARMLEALESDYVRTARAKGVRERRVLWTHALRNSLLPVLSVPAALTPPGRRRGHRDRLRPAGRRHPPRRVHPEPRFPGGAGRDHRRDRRCVPHQPPRRTGLRAGGSAGAA